ncbi:hypothetical protein AB0G05_04995 [Nonomuraea wenchangensis]
MIDTTDPATLVGLRDRVVLVLGFALMGRRSELAALDIADLTFTADGLEVAIRRSKTDQDAFGEIVPLPYGSHPATCPVRVVQAWLAMLEERGVAEGPLLRAIDRHGRLSGTSGATMRGTVAGRRSHRWCTATSGRPTNGETTPCAGWGSETVSVADARTRYRHRSTDRRRACREFGEACTRTRARRTGPGFDMLVHTGGPGVSGLSGAIYAHARETNN